MMKMVIFQSLGGLGLFLFGMKIMSEGLQRVAGSKMRQILGLVSNNRVIGCLVGTGVTSVIQSSSAMTVMLVGFVDAGLMTLRQAIGVILGANIGTTVTAQLIAFKIEDYALPAVALGVLLKFFIGRKKWRYVGDVLLGFGLVFFGLSLMKTGFAPLRTNPTFIAFFTKFQADTLVGIMLCVLAGAALTMILQSSSATVGITMALASQGLLSFEASVALILGENVGTTVTAQLAAVGASDTARETAMAHSLFNVLGVLNIILIFPYFVDLVSWATSLMFEEGGARLLVDGEYPYVARYIANAHTLFNVVNAVVFLGLLPYLVRAAVWLTPGKAKEDVMEEMHHVKYLDSRFVETPSVAIGQARAETIRMGEIVEVMYNDVVNCLKDRQMGELSKWRKREDAVDILQKEITQFLVRVVQGPITPEESKEVNSLIRMVNNFERMGDAVENLAELIQELIEQDLHLSEGGLYDYQVISDEARRFIRLVIEAMKKDDKTVMGRAQVLEDSINNMREEMRGNYLMRLQSGICTVDPGLILVDMLTAFEKIGDYCYNIAQAVAGVK